MSIQSNLLKTEGVITVTTGKDITLEGALFDQRLHRLPIIHMEQVHGDRWQEITSADSTTIPGVDGIFTFLPNIALVVRTADCLPILISHPSGLIAALHAGRAGTQRELLKKFLKYLRDKHSIARDLDIWFGPAICAECYQIDRETDVHYDLLSENKSQLKAVFTQDVYQLTMDTTCTKQTERLYSYRREGADAGRNYSLIANS